MMGVIKTLHHFFLTLTFTQSDKKEDLLSDVF
jgi:hypothetical protein